MRKLLSSALMVVLLAFPASGLQAQQDSDIAKLQSLETQLMNAYKARQVDSLASLLDDDFVITFEDGSVYGKLGYVSYSATPSVKVDLAEMSDLKIRIYGNTAVLTGAYHERGNDKAKVYDNHDRFTDVWMKKSGQWRLISSHYAIPVGK